MKELSTDLDREDWNTKDDPQERKALLVIMVACLVAGIVGPMLILLYADRIDAFMNTLAGALTIIAVCGVCGVWWFVWTIKKMF